MVCPFAVLFMPRVADVDENDVRVQWRADHTDEKRLMERDALP